MLTGPYKFYIRCVMALIRGTNSKFPCPICLVPLEELSNLSSDFSLRTKENMRKLFQEAQELNAAESESLLKSQGIRDVEVGSTHSEFTVWTNLSILECILENKSLRSLQSTIL